MSPEADLVDGRSVNAGARFFAEHEVPAGAEVPAVTDLGDYPGLVFLRVVEDDDGSLSMGTYWLSRQDFEASRKPFERRAGATALRRSGFLRQVLLPSKPLSKRLGGYVLWVVASLGALEALQNHYSRLFEGPEISADLGGPEASDVAENRPLDLDLTLTNGSQCQESP